MASEAIARLVQQIKAFPTSANAFNQYASFDPEIEGADAPEIRCRNLARYIEAISSTGDRDLWLFEAPSRRGAVRTGVPQTSADRLGKRAEQLGMDEGFEAVPGQMDEETRPSQTSRRVAKFFDLMPRKPIIWNAVMIHTRSPDGKNRAPRPSELRQHQHVLWAIRDLCKPAKVIACGEVAQSAIRMLGLEFERVPHPVAKQSPSFKAAMTRLYGIET